MTPHGSYSTYCGHKCRCDECRAANAAYHANNRVERRLLLAAGKVFPIHGTTNTYNNYGCRCEFCREAWTANRRRQQARRRAVKA